MSAAAEAATASAPAPAPAKGKGKKKLVVIIAATVLGLALAGGAAMVLMKHKVDPDAETTEAGDSAAGDSPAKAVKTRKHDPKAVPVFVPLDPFTVNLADRNAERFAQVAVTLEIDDAKLGDQIKAYMPAIRNNILLVIADRTAAELMGREGKVALAGRIQRAASRALGAEVEEAEEAAAADDRSATETPAAKPKKKKPKPAAPELPIKAVHFSNIIIQ